MGKSRGIKKIAVMAALGACFMASACQTPMTTSVPAPTNDVTNRTTSDIPVAPLPVARNPSVPVMVSGSGESVQTVNLEPGGYTVEFSNTSGHMIVKPVNRDGTSDRAFIISGDTTGVTTYSSNGPVTLQIEARGPWTLNFVPLS